jgi:hypothetical protein
MGMRLQDAINFALDPANSQPPISPFGLDTAIEVTMHDETDTVLVGGAVTTATFLADVPLRNWGTGTISPPGSVVSRWFNRQIPGFSTRGQGGLMMNVAAASAVPFATPTPIDVSVRRDPGVQALRFLGLGPSVQIEIEKLTTLGGGGTATTGITLQATEDGALLRAVGPSLRDPATLASYTVTLMVWRRIG